MRLAPVGVMWMSAVMVLALGCNSASSPLGTFKSLVDTKVSTLRSKYPNVPIKKFEFDVKKTDSLVSPYLGTIIIETTCPLIGDFSQDVLDQLQRFEPNRKIKASIYEEDMKISLYYAWQDGKWTYKNGEFVKSNVRVLQDGSGSAEKGARNTNAEGPRSTEIKLANQLPSIFQVLDEQHAELAKIFAPKVAEVTRPKIEKPKPVGKVFKSAESVTNSIGMELIGIPAGTFTMGKKNRFEDEAQVGVTLTKSFGLGKYEVTQGQWKSVMNTEPWGGKGLRDD